MCPDSIKMGRRTTSAQSTISVGTTSTSLVGEAPGRIALIIQAPSANRFTLSLASTAVLDQGITLYASGATLVLTLAEHGEMVTRAWNAISQSVIQNVTVIEVFLAD